MQVSRRGAAVSLGRPELISTRDSNYVLLALTKTPEGVGRIADRHERFEARGSEIAVRDQKAGAFQYRTETRSAGLVIHREEGTYNRK